MVDRAPLVEVSTLRGNKIEIPDYVIGSSPWLQRITLTSNSETDLSVRLTSDLGPMLRFQSENPNLGYLTPRPNTALSGAVQLRPRPRVLQ